MKKIYALLLTIGFSGSILAQSEWMVPEENVGMLTKITATWCNPCGTWGWDAMEEILASHSDDHIVISMYAPSSSKLYNPTAEEIAGEIGFSGTPNFAGNGLDQGTSVAQATAIVDTFKTAPVIAVPAYAIEWVNADSIVIEVKTKFFEGVNGKFHLKVFAVEDHVVEEQNGHEEDVPHHMVVRKGFVSLNDSTSVILDGTASAGDEISKKYVIEMDAEWNLEDLYIMSTLWMENPSEPADLWYVNGQKIWQEGELEIGYGTDAPVYYPPSQWPIGVEEVKDVDVELYPNPAKDRLTVKLSDATDSEIVLTDLLGKEVYRADFTSRDLITIDVTDMPSGVYMIKVKTENNDHYDRVVVK